MEIYQIMYQNVLIETKQYPVLIRFYILVSNLTFVDVVMFGDIFDTHLFRKQHLKDMFSTNYQVQNDHTNRENISGVCKQTAIYNVFRNQNVDCSAPTPFAFSLSN